MAQAHIYLGDFDRAASLLRTTNDVASDRTTHYGTARLLHRSIGNFETARSIAITLVHVDAEGRATWLCQAMIDAIDGNDLDAAAEIIRILPEEWQDAFLLPRVVMELHAGQDLDQDMWNRIRSTVLSVEEHDYIKLRVGLEIAWHSAQNCDNALARKRADQLRWEPALHLPINRPHLLAFEAMAAGIDPRLREAASCLEARACLWDRDGRRTAPGPARPRRDRGGIVAAAAVLTACEMW